MIYSHLIGRNSFGTCSKSQFLVQLIDGFYVDGLLLRLCWIHRCSCFIRRRKFIMWWIRSVAMERDALGLVWLRGGGFGKGESSLIRRIWRRIPASVMAWPFPASLLSLPRRGRGWGGGGGGGEDVLGRWPAVLLPGLWSDINHWQVWRIKHVIPLAGCVLVSLSSSHPLPPPPPSVLPASSPHRLLFVLVLVGRHRSFR